MKELLPAYLPNDFIIRKNNNECTQVGYILRAVILSSVLFCVYLYEDLVHEVRLLRHKGIFISVKE